jgi:hypothetical protein
MDDVNARARNPACVKEPGIEPDVAKRWAKIECIDKIDLFRSVEPLWAGLDRARPLEVRHEGTSDALLLRHASDDQRV